MVSMFTFDFDPAIIMWECKTECGKSPDGLSQRYAEETLLFILSQQEAGNSKSAAFSTWVLSAPCRVSPCISIILLSPPVPPHPAIFSHALTLKIQPTIQEFRMDVTHDFLFSPDIWSANPWKSDKNVQRRQDPGQMHWCPTAKHQPGIKKSVWIISVTASVLTVCDPCYYFSLLYKT